MIIKRNTFVFGGKKLIGLEVGRIVLCLAMSRHEPYKIATRKHDPEYC